MSCGINISPEEAGIMCGATAPLYTISTCGMLVFIQTVAAGGWVYADGSVRAWIIASLLRVIEPHRTGYPASPLSRREGIRIVKVPQFVFCFL